MGFNIDDFTFEGAVVRAKNLIDGQKVSQVVTINPEMIQAAEKDSNFANIIKEAEMVIPDGVGIKLALKLTGKKAYRIPGIDFAKRMLEEAASTNIPVAVVGAKQEVVTKAVENLQKEISGLNIVYVHNGYFGDSESIYEELRAKAPKLILVALGSPKQELLMEEMMEKHSAIYQGLGGSFDVYAGRVERAPKWWVEHNLDFAYRLLKQPSRIKRQIHLVKFLLLLYLGKY